MKQNLLWYSIIGLFIFISTIVLFFTKHPLHEELHTIGAFVAVFLAILSFRSYFNYKLHRLLFSAFAFLAFGVGEGMEIVFDTEFEADPLSINEIRDYIIILGLGLFGLGTIPKIRK
jgi:hypothetical protein